MPISQRFAVRCSPERHTKPVYILRRITRKELRIRVTAMVAEKTHIQTQSQRGKIHIVKNLKKLNFCGSFFVNGKLAHFQKHFMV